MAQDGTQDYQAWNVILGGDLITGFARGTSYSAVYDEDQFETVVGNRGLGAWLRRINLSATVTIELLATSLDNDLMTALWVANYRNRRGGGFGVPLVAKDARGTTTQVAGLIRPTKIPDVVRSDSIDSRSWVLKTTNLQTHVGGNFGPTVGTAAEARALAAALRPLPQAA